MRIFKIILSILFTFIFIISIGLNIIVLSSSTNMLLFNDSVDARTRLYFTSTKKLENIKSFTATIYNHNTNEEDNIYCRYKYDQETKNTLHDCSMISYLYDNSKKLIRTSYFPGDGFKYYKEGELTGKLEYSNQELLSYALSAPARMYYHMTYYLALDPNDYIDEEKNISMSYDTSLDFIFKEFSFSKSISLNYDANGSKTVGQFDFDGKERITKTHILLPNTSDLNNTITISYNYIEPTVPSFVGHI